MTGADSLGRGGAGSLPVLATQAIAISYIELDTVEIGLLQRGTRGWTQTDAALCGGVASGGSRARGECMHVKTAPPSPPHNTSAPAVRLITYGPVRLRGCGSDGPLVICSRVAATNVKMGRRSASRSSREQRCDECPPRRSSDGRGYSSVIVAEASAAGESIMPRWIPLPHVRPRTRGPCATQLSRHCTSRAPHQQPRHSTTYTICVASEMETGNCFGLRQIHLH